MVETLVRVAKARLAQGDSAYKIDNRTAAQTAKRLGYNPGLFQHESRGQTRRRVDARAQALVQTDGVPAHIAKKVVVKEERKTRAIRQRMRLDTIETTKEAVAKNKQIDEGLVELLENKV